MPTVLLVEDNRMDETLIFHILQGEGLKEEEIVVARDGAEAIDYLFATGAYSRRDKNILPAIVILDLHLPKLNGIEVLRRIRQAPHTKTLTVAIFSSSLDTQNLLKSDELGAEAYIHKSPDLVEYARAIKELVQKLK